MPDFIINPPDVFQALFDQHDQDVFLDVENNPGTLEADIVTRTGKAAIIVSTVIEVSLQAGVLTRRSDASGQSRYYTAEAWAGLVRNNLSGERAWVDNPANEGRKASDMAADLGVDAAVALQLAHVLQFEGKARIKAI